jgi:hypothetical protein
VRRRLGILILVIFVQVVLVPHGGLPSVEAALMLRGWATGKTTAYDQRYYRRWMHELPPLRHIGRQTWLDVHHAILPITARLKPDSAKLLAASRPDRAADGLASLARGSLYVRAHWLRMPLLLLAQHLTIKALRREEQKAG